MARKRPARIGNPDLRQQKHIPSPPIEEIEKQIFSLLSPAQFKPLKSYEHKPEQEQELHKKWRDRILTKTSDDGDRCQFSLSTDSRIKRSTLMSYAKRDYYGWIEWK